MAAWCAVTVPGICAGQASHRHHVKRRSQGGTDGWENTLDVCGRCHEYIHAHPEESYVNGWLARSTT